MMYAHEDASCLLQPMSSFQSPDALLHEMVGSLQFVEGVRYRFAFEDHINALGQSMADRGQVVGIMQRVSFLQTRVSQ
eukprot:82795-Amphidinium_carterae.1